MPQTLQEMVNETNPNIKIEQSTFPGMPLNGHLSEIITSRTENEISTRNKKESEKTETEKKNCRKKVGYYCFTNRFSKCFDTRKP